MLNNNNDLRKTPLYDKHLEAGAKMVPFSGWNMPVQYIGIIEEHVHTRTKAGLFDICHMGEFFLKGPSAEKDVETLVTCRIDDMPEGKCRYGFLLNENAGIIDDLIVFKLSSEEFMLVVNAGTIQKDRAWIESHISSGTTFQDRSENTAKLDIQGPLSLEVIAELTGDENIQDIKRFCFRYVDIEGIEVLLSRTGYTGEAGYELFFPAEHAEKLWDMFLACDGVKPVGLGARDTLRMEMGYSLYGNDIDESHTPFESDLTRFVFMEKDFIGKEALLKKQVEGGFEKVLRGFVCEGRRSARSHFTVLVDGKGSGVVTSGTFSPCLKKGIGLCYISRGSAAEGRKITLTDGRVEINAEIKNVPLYKKI